MRGRILLVHLLSLVAGGPRPAARQPPPVVLRRRVGVPRRRPSHDAVVRPAPPTPQRALEHCAVPHLSPARGGVRDSLVLAVHRPRDPVAPRRRPPRVAGDAAGQDHAVGGHRRRAAAARSRSRLPEPALGVPDRVPRLGRARPRDDVAREPRGSVAATRLGGTRPGRLRAALVGRLGAPRRRLRPRRRCCGGDQAGGRIRDSAGASSTSSGRSCLSAADEPRRAVGARVRRRPVAVRRHGAEHGGGCLRPRCAAARLDRARAAGVYLVRTAERATTRSRWCTRAPPGRSPSSCSRPTGVRSSAWGRRPRRATDTSRSCCWHRRSRWSPTGCCAGRSTPFRAVFVVVFRCWSRHRTASSSATTRPTRRRASCRSAARFSRPRRSRTIRRRSSCRTLAPEPHYSPDLTVADLRRFGANGELPTLRPSLDAQLTAAANLQVGIAKAEAVAACPAPPDRLRRRFSAPGPTA